MSLSRIFRAVAGLLALVSMYVMFASPEVDRQVALRQLLLYASTQSIFVSKFFDPVSWKTHWGKVVLEVSRNLDLTL